MATYDQAIFQRGEERDIKGESVAAEHRLETKESGRCRELLNKSHCKDFLSVETKKVIVVLERWPMAEVRRRQFIII